ncbi:MAG: hypothetical protein ABIO71_00935 [Caldimonas sp.]
MKEVELWHWRYRSPKTGRMCRTLLPVSAREAAIFPDSERIEGTRLVIAVEEPAFGDTTPRAYLKGPP